MKTPTKPRVAPKPPSSKPDAIPADLSTLTHAQLVALRDDLKTRGRTLRAKNDPKGALALSREARRVRRAERAARK